MNAETPRKPTWPESGGIAPQHRQFPDTYAEDLTASVFGTLAPFAWGISKLQIDEEALARGSVRVVAFEGRFLSGLPALLAPREALERALEPRPGLRDVHLSVAVAMPAGDSPNVTNSREIGARYFRLSYDGVSVLRPNLRILFDEEHSESSERLPFARVLLSGGRPELDSRFVPPLLRVFPGSPVASAAHEIVAALCHRQAELLSALSARPVDLRAFAPARIPQLLALSAINEALALLDQAGPQAALAPRELHERLSDLLGSLESLRGRAGEAIPSYVHHDAGPGFRTIAERLAAVIPSVARDPHIALPLERRDAWTFAATLPEPELFRRRAFIVASGADDRVLSAHLPAHAKIASAAWLPNLIHSALRGVPIATEFDPPASLPSSANHCCFKVDTRSELWADVIQQGSLMVHVPEAPSGLQLTVYAIQEARS